MLWELQKKLGLHKHDTGCCLYHLAGRLGKGFSYSALLQGPHKRYAGKAQDLQLPLLWLPRKSIRVAGYSSKLLGSHPETQQWRIQPWATIPSPWGNDKDATRDDFYHTRDELFTGIASADFVPTPAAPGQQEPPHTARTRGTPTYASLRRRPK